MTTSAKRSYGTLFKQGSTTIAEVTSIGEVGDETDMIEVTNFDSPSMRKEYISGLIDPGELAIEMNMIAANASQTGLRTLQSAGTSAAFSIVFTDTGETATFTAFVKSFKSVPNTPADSLKRNLVMKVTGVITWT